MISATRKEKQGKWQRRIPILEKVVEKSLSEEVIFELIPEESEKRPYIRLTKTIQSMG